MSLSTRETKERSIFRMSTGRCFSRDVAHVPGGQSGGRGRRRSTSFSLR
jgi:hypothetical protein